MQDYCSYKKLAILLFKYRFQYLYKVFNYKKENRRCLGMQDKNSSIWRHLSYDHTLHHTHMHRSLK